MVVVCGQSPPAQPVTTAFPAKYILKPYFSISVSRPLAARAHTVTCELNALRAHGGRGDAQPHPAAGSHANPASAPITIHL